MGPEASETLEKALRRMSKAGELCENLDSGEVGCLACAHHCRIKDGDFGTCRVRFNEGGTLRVPWGYVSSVQLEAMEKKPFFHALPGGKVLSFGMLGCDYRCAYCQNWVSSQALRDPAAGMPVQERSPGDIVREARASGAAALASSHNEPLVTSEWAAAIFKEARKAGLRCAYVSNGHASRQVLEYLRPWVDFFKVDLKGFDEERYRSVAGGALKPVLDAISRLAELGVWTEVVTLVIPAVNDSDAELRGIARFLASVSKDLPWHIGAFHKDYKMTGPADTPAETLERAAQIGRSEGLRYVYAGRFPGHDGDFENTRCPKCRALLVERFGSHVRGVHLRLEGSRGFCPSCRTAIPGVWA